MSNISLARPLKLAGIIAWLAALSACTSIGYRCPLDPSDKAEDATACASMQDAMAGAKKQTGGKVSVLMDDKGRLVPPELLSKTTARPLANQGVGPFREKTGSPVFVQPKVFQVYTESFQDANGNLHDGHHSYFSTPGRWSYGTMDRGTAAGAHVMGPSRPTDRPDGRIVTMDPRTGLPAAAPQTSPTPPSAAQQAAAVNSAATASTAMSTQQRERAALQNLSSAANNAAANANMANARIQGQQAQGQVSWPGSAPGVTQPAVKLGN